MKIALLTHSVNPRGGVVHTLELARALHDAGHAVTVFAPAAPGQALFRRVPFAVELVPVPAAPKDMVTMVAGRIDATVRHIAALPGRGAFDIWHAQDSISGNALADLADAGLIDGFIRTVHHLDHFDEPPLMHWQRRAYERARQVFCVSPLWCRTLLAEHGIDAMLVHNGVDLQRYRPEAQALDAEVAAKHGLRPGAPLWLAVGGVEERKNTLRLFEAFVQHRQQRPDTQLAIVGGASLLDHDAYQAAFREAVAAAGIGDALRLTGPVADAEMPSLFRLADGLLMPSLREGFGLVVLEALASGTPVVVSRQAPFTEYLAETDVHWADPCSSTSIAAAMQRALAQPLHGVPDVCHRYSWPASAARHVALYRALHALA
ncbi:MAG: MSMEG_0565 family glycosyltransferase [Bacteroidia bacterium]